MNSTHTLPTNATEKKPIARKAGGASYIIAKIVRVVTVPPVMVGTLILLLSAMRPDVVTSLGESLLALLFLAILPVLAYPVSALIPSVRAKGRDGQRNLAFVFSAIGYTGGVVYALAAGVNTSLAVIFWTYFISVILLTLLNKVIRVKASGHACSIAGPIGLVCYFLPPILIPVCLALYGVIFWASVRMGRHTVREFILGSITSPLALAMVALTAALL